MIPADLGNVDKYTQIFYYSGVGVVLYGTGVRFLYRFFRKRDRRSDLLDELEALDVHVHLLRIYTALKRIGDKLDIDLAIGPQDEEAWLIKKHPRPKSLVPE